MKIRFQSPIIITRTRPHIAVAELDLGPRICRALKRAGYVYLDEINVDRLKHFRNLGAKSIERIEELLNE